MTDTLPPSAVSAADTIAAIEQRYTPTEISGIIKSLVANIANGHDWAADDLALFMTTLPQDWREDHPHDEASY